MLRRDLAPGTVRIYRWAVADLFNYLKSAGVDDISGLSRDHLERWQDTLADPERKPKPLKATTRNMAHNGVRQMLRFAADHDLVDWRMERWLVKVKVRQAEPRPIPRADYEVLRDFLLPRRPRMNIVALRDRALFFFMITTTARVSEALQLRRDDLDDPIVRQKGGSEKMLRMPPITRQLLDDYLRARTDSSPWVWIGFRSNGPAGRRIDPAGVLKIWQKLARKLGLKPFTTHQLRHTGASELFAAGVSELAIMDTLGHHGLGTLHRYTKVPRQARDQVLEVMEELVQPSRPQLKVLPKIPPGPR